MKYSFILLLAILSYANTVFADTEIINVQFLPLDEAVKVVNTQLSKTGRVSALPSRHVLVIEDDEKHIKQAKKLLKKLDEPVEQYSVEVTFNMMQKKKIKHLKNSVNLPGGWIKITQKNMRTKDKQRFQLRTTANQRASIEMGELRSYRQQTRAWLTSYGLLKQHSVNLIPITSGFYVSVWKAGDDKVKIRLQPWMRAAATSSNVQGNTEILFDLGSTTSPKQIPSNQAPLRYNASPNISANSAIEITSAITELTLPIGKSVTIIAVQNEAQQLGRALLSRYSMTSNKDLTIQLTVQKY